MQINNINNTNFKAIPLAKIKIKDVDKTYKLFEITKSDQSFLNDFYQDLHLEKLMPNLEDFEYLAWEDVISGAVSLANKGARKTILETCNDKPCGLLNYREYPLKFHINYVATFPVEPNIKVPAAGQILFNEFFKRVADSCKDIIELQALKYSPFSPISKYLKLGFKPVGGTRNLETMRMSREDMLSALKKQDEFISYTQEVAKSNINLENMQKTGKKHRLSLPFLD